MLYVQPKECPQNNPTSPWIVAGVMVTSMASSHEQIDLNLLHVAHGGVLPYSLQDMISFHPILACVENVPCGKCSVCNHWLNQRLFSGIRTVRVIPTKEETLYKSLVVSPRRRVISVSELTHRSRLLNIDKWDSKFKSGYIDLASVWFYFRRFTRNQKILFF